MGVDKVCLEYEPVVVAIDVVHAQERVDLVGGQTLMISSSKPSSRAAALVYPSCPVSISRR